jgi:peptide/nickel transport system substrate-binding protein
MLLSNTVPMKRSSRAAAALALVCLLGAPSCARRTVPRAAVSDTLSRLLDGDPATLDPIVSSEDFGIRVEDYIFRPLVGIDKTLRFVPSLATSWAVSSDGLVYDFRLDPKARWEDGTPVTSEDVAYTIERIRDPKVAAVIWRWGFEDVTRVETPDPATVIVRFAQANATRLLAFTVPIVSAAAYRRGTGLDRQPVGSGPYRLESWSANQKIVLLRRPDASADQFPFTRVVFRVIPDGSVRFRAGLAGDVDEFRVSRDQRAGAVRSKEFDSKNRLLKVPQFSVVLLVWNMHNPFLADARVRLALAHCWDRADAARRLYPPDGASLLSGPYPASARENAPEIHPISYDPAESARLLDAAGLLRGPDGARRKGGRKVSFELLYPGVPPYVNIAEIFRSAAEKVGIEMLPRPLEWAAYTQRFAAGEFDISPIGQGFTPPTNLDQYTFFHSSQAPPEGQNAGFYRNPAVDSALEAARREMDPARRLELYRQVHRLLAADPPADFLWSVDQYWAVSKRLDGVEVSPIGLFHFLPGPLAWRAILPKG